MTFYEPALLDKYIELIVRVGLNIQPEQPLVINSPVECAYFARRVADYAYENNASVVYIRWSDDYTSRLKYLYASHDAIDNYPEWEKLMTDSLTFDGAAFLNLDTTDVAILQDIPVERILRVNRAAYTALRDHLEKMMGNYIRWCVVAIPTRAWAESVFPGEAEDVALRKLWQGIFASCRVDENDTVESWRLHVLEMKKQRDILNRLKLVRLRIHDNAGTNLVLELPRGHHWAGGLELARDHVPYLSNIPAEKIYTAPHRGSVSGTVTNRYPVFFGEQMISKIKLTFENGQVVRVEAPVDEDYARAYIEQVDHLDRLGEIALVPAQSPVARTGLTFYHTLYDENACCHITLGQAYPECVKSGPQMTPDELRIIGLNACAERISFTFGDESLKIEAMTDLSEWITIFENGSFVELR